MVCNCAGWDKNWTDFGKGWTASSLGAGGGEGATHHFFQHLIRSFWEKGKARSLIIKTIRENLSNGSQETFFFLGWEMLVHRLAIGDLEAREVCDYLSRLTWKQRRRQRHREQQKSNRFRLAKQQLCTCITLFYTFLCRRCSNATWKCL